MSSDYDIKLAIVKLEQSFTHILETLGDQRELLNSLLIDSQSRNEESRKLNYETDATRRRLEDQIEAIKYNLESVHSRIEAFYKDLSAYKEDSISTKNKLDKIDRKIDNDWLFILKIFGLVLAGAVLGASVMTRGVLSWLGIGH